MDADAPPLPAEVEARAADAVEDDNADKVAQVAQVEPAAAEPEQPPPLPAAEDEPAAPAVETAAAEAPSAEPEQPAAPDAAAIPDLAEPVAANEEEKEEDKTAGEVAAPAAAVTADDAVPPSPAAPDATTTTPPAQTEADPEIPVEAVPKAETQQLRVPLHSLHALRRQGASPPATATATADDPAPSAAAAAEEDAPASAPAATTTTTTTTTKSSTVQRLNDTTRRLRELDAKLGARSSKAPAGGVSVSKPRAASTTTAAAPPARKPLSRDEVEALGARLCTPRTAANAAPAPPPPALRLVYEKSGGGGGGAGSSTGGGSSTKGAGPQRGGREVWVPVQKRTKEEQEQAMSALYERCMEAKRKTARELAEKYLSSTFGPPTAAKAKPAAAKAAAAAPEAAVAAASP